MRRPSKRIPMYANENRTSPELIKVLDDMFDKIEELESTVLRLCALNISALSRKGEK